MDKKADAEVLAMCRCYRGEETNPYAGGDRGRAVMWDVERAVCETQDKASIDSQWGDADKDGIPDSIKDAGIPDGEKAFAYAVYVAADGFVTDEAFGEYLGWGKKDAE